MYKNYYMKDKILIPCSDQLDRITYNFTDENDKQLVFDGNIYLLITFKTN